MGDEAKAMGNGTRPAHPATLGPFERMLWMWEYEDCDDRDMEFVESMAIADNAIAELRTRYGAEPAVHDGDEYERGRKDERENVARAIERVSFGLRGEPWDVQTAANDALARLSRELQLRDDKRGRADASGENGDE